MNNIDVTLDGGIHNSISKFKEDFSEYRDINKINVYGCIKIRIRKRGCKKKELKNN